MSRFNPVTALFQFEPIEQRQYFDSSHINKPVDYVHPFEEYEPGYGRRLTAEGQTLMTMIQRHLADYLTISVNPEGED